MLMMTEGMQSKLILHLLDEDEEMSLKRGLLQKQLQEKQAGEEKQGIMDLSKKMERLFYPQTRLNIL